MSVRYNQKLAHMAEQIIANMSFSDDPEIVSDQVADHIGRFWGPGMRENLVEYARSPEAELSNVLRRTVEKVAFSLDSA